VQQDNLVDKVLSFIAQIVQTVRYKICLVGVDGDFHNLSKGPMRQKKGD